MTLPMTFLQAPTSWLTALLAAGGYRIIDSKAPNQLFSSAPSAGLSINNPTGASIYTLVPGSQSITAPAGVVTTLIIPSAIVRQLAGANAPNMPGEALELTSECGASFFGCWVAQFQAIGFQVFTPTVYPLPSMNC
jgi:hypothetical protein